MAKKVNGKDVAGGGTPDPEVKTSGAEKNDEVQQAVQEGRQPRKEGNWIKMSKDEMIAHQNAGDLMGWDAKNGEGLLKLKK